MKKWTQWTLRDSKERWVDFFNREPETNSICIQAANCDRLDLFKAGVLFDESVGLNMVVVSLETARKAWDQLIDLGFTRYTPPELYTNGRRRSRRTRYIPQLEVDDGTNQGNQR